MRIKDSSGREYELRLSLDAIARFERRTGAQFFKDLFSAFNTGGDSTQSGLQVFSSLFGSVDKLVALLYECCVIPPEQKGLPLVEFSSRFSLGTILPISQEIMLDIVSQITPPTSGAEGKDKGPFVP